MAKRQVVTVGPIASGSANYYVTSVTPSSGQVLTLAHTKSPDSARRVLATVGSEAAPRTIALTGTNSAGQTIQETIVIPASSAGTYQSAQDFLTISVTKAGGGAWTAPMTLGTDGVASSPWQQVSQHITPVNIGINCVVTGTANYTVEYTNDDLEPPLPTTTNGAPYGPMGPIPPIPTPFPNAVLDGLAVNGTGMIVQPIVAWRLTLNSGSGSVTATGIEAGIIQGH